MRFRKKYTGEELQNAFKLARLEDVGTTRPVPLAEIESLRLLAHRGMEELCVSPAIRNLGAILVALRGLVTVLKLFGFIKE